MRLLTPCGPAPETNTPRRTGGALRTLGGALLNPVRAALLGASFATSLLAPGAEAKTGPAAGEAQAAAPSEVQAAYDQAVRSGNRAELSALVQNPVFLQLDRRVQVDLLRTVALHASAGAARDRATIIQLGTSPGFAALTRPEQGRLLRYVGGRNREVSTPARAQLGTLLRSNTFKTANASGQHQRLLAFLQQQTPTIVASTTSPALTKRARFEIGRAVEVAQVQFRSGTAVGQRAIVTIGGQEIPVYLPSSKARYAGRLPTLDQIARALAGLPPKTRALIKEVYANPGPNPTNSGFAVKFDQTDFTSLMTAGANGVVSIYPSRGGSSMNVIDHSLAHESGHVLSFKAFGQGYGRAGWNKWRAAAKADGLTVSAYARKSIGEDFSETLVVYLSSMDDPAAHAELRAIFPARFKILDQLLR